MSLVAPPGLQDAGTNELLAMLEVMYFVAIADGFFSNEERSEFLKIVESLSEGKLGPEQLASLVDSWVKSGDTQIVDERLSELAHSLPDEMSRRIAYGLAMQIADADGMYLESEALVMAKIAKAFGLKEDDSKEITHSVRMSRRPTKPG